MKIYKLFIVTVLCLVFFNCTVTEKIIFKEDGGGTFVTEYDMGSVMKQFEDAFKDMDLKGAEEDMDDEMEDNLEEDSEEIEEVEVEESIERKSVVMDTTMYFKDLIEERKDSIAKLSIEEREVFESIKDMYMTMKMNQDQGMFTMGIGMEFKSVEDLSNMQEKLKNAQTMNKQATPMASTMGDNPFMKSLTGDQGQTVIYDFNANSFSRTTTIEIAEEDKFKIEELGDSDELKDGLGESFYIIEYTFPKTIKSTSIKDAQISEDGKTLTSKINWIEFLKDPKQLDLNVEFENE